MTDSILWAVLWLVFLVPCPFSWFLGNVLLIHGGDSEDRAQTVTGIVLAWVLTPAWAVFCLVQAAIAFASIWGYI